jgi:hypothetical protein
LPRNQQKGNGQQNKDEEYQQCAKCHAPRFVANNIVLAASRLGKGPDGGDQGHDNTYQSGPNQYKRQPLWNCNVHGYTQ